MITKWSVSNFKSIKKTRVINPDGTESGELELAPLTILCGANSSGKSSLLQSILMLAQTMRQQDKEYPVILNGDFVSLGTFDDIKSGDGNEIEIKFSFKPRDVNAYTPNFTEYATKFFYFRLAGLDYSFKFCKGENEKAILPELSHSELLIRFMEEDIYKTEDDDRDDSIYFYKYSSSNIENNKIINFDESFGVLNENVTSTTNKYLSNDFILNLFLPEKITCNGMRAIMTRLLDKIYTFVYHTYNEAHFNESHDDEKIESSYYSNIIPPGLKCLLQDLLSDIEGLADLFEHPKDNEQASSELPVEKWQEALQSLDNTTLEEVKQKMYKNYSEIYKKTEEDFSQLMKEYEQKKRDYIEKGLNDYFLTLGPAFRPYWYFDHKLSISQDLDTIYSEIYNHYAQSIFYLAPLREDPKSLYNFNHSTYLFDIGKKGQNTASILALKGNAIKEYLVFNLETRKLTKESISLKEAVARWLKYIGVAKDVEAKIEKDGFTLKVKTSDSSPFSDLTHVGMGVSQVLPIVVMCLAVPERSMLIIEQPELHLHPKMQTKLMDFFVAISESGKQCIIETHSEHFINAMRYRIAMRDSPEDTSLADKTQIYFTEKDDDGTLFRSIKINKYSAISDWPDGFFDESSKTADEIFKYASKKWKQDKKDNQ